MKASKEHVRIGWRSGGYRLSDLESRYGTTINGRRLERRALRNLDRIDIGSTVLMFESDA